MPHLTTPRRWARRLDRWSGGGGLFDEGAVVVACLGIGLAALWTGGAGLGWSVVFAPVAGLAVGLPAVLALALAWLFVIAPALALSGWALEALDARHGEREAVSGFALHARREREIARASQRRP